MFINSFRRFEYTCVNPNRGTMNPAKRLGLYLRHHRKAHGLTQEHLAELCDLTPEHISAIERGRRYPSMKTLIRMADVLQVTLAEAFQFQKPRPKPKTKPLTEKDSAIKGLVRVLVRWSVRDIRLFTVIARRMR